MTAQSTGLAREAADTVNRPLKVGQDCGGGPGWQRHAAALLRRVVYARTQFRPHHPGFTDDLFPLRFKKRREFPSFRAVKAGSHNGFHTLASLR